MKHSLDHTLSGTYRSNTRTLGFGLMALALFAGFTANSQTDSGSVWQQKPVVTLSGFIDVFYVYDFNQPQSTTRQPFLYNHNRHNEVNVNLGLVKFNVEHPKYRANIALQAGTYVNDNYTNEPGLLKNLFEANAGLSLHKKNKVWLDAGIMSSHIGFEGAVSTDNWNLTRSMLAENSPYFHSGVKLSLIPSSKLEVAALLLNGWQRIQRRDGNSMLSGGTQLLLKPSENIKINWSTFVGTDDPDSTRRMRYFSNLYGQFQLTKRFGLIAGFDLGAQQRSKSSVAYDYWLSPVAIAQFSVHPNWKVALRAEYYQDETGIIIFTGTPNGFKTSGASINVDYTPNPNIVCRIEGRWLNSKDAIFTTNTSTSYTNFIIGASLAVKFSDVIGR